MSLLLRLNTCYIFLPPRQTYRKPKIGKHLIQDFPDNFEFGVTVYIGAITNKSNMFVLSPENNHQYFIDIVHQYRFS